MPGTTASGSNCHVNHPIRYLAGWTVKRTGVRSLLSTLPKLRQWRHRVHIQSTLKSRPAFPSTSAPTSHLKPAETPRRWAWHSGFWTSEFFTIATQSSAFGKSPLQQTAKRCVFVASCLILCGHSHRFGYSKHSWYQNEANHWSVAIGRAQFAYPHGRIAQGRRWGRLPLVWWCFNKAFIEKQSLFHCALSPQALCNTKLRNVQRTAALPIAKRVGKQTLRVRNLGPGRSIPSTLLTVLLFALTTTLVAVPWASVGQISQCGSLLRCVGLLQRTPRWDHWQTSEFLEDAPVLPACDNMITRSLEATSCLSAGIDALVLPSVLSRGNAPLLPFVSAFSGKQPRGSSFDRLVPDLPSDDFIKHALSVTVHPMARPCPLLTRLVDTIGSAAKLADNLVSHRWSLFQIVLENNMNSLLRANLGEQVSLAIRLLYLAVGIFPFLNVCWTKLVMKTNICCTTSLAFHWSCACFWRIVTQICERNSVSVRVLV